MENWTLFFSLSGIKFPTTHNTQNTYHHYVQVRKPKLKSEKGKKREFDLFQEHHNEGCSMFILFSYFLILRTCSWFWHIQQQISAHFHITFLLSVKCFFSYLKALWHGKTWRTRLFIFIMEGFSSCLSLPYIYWGLRWHPLLYKIQHNS